MLTRFQRFTRVGLVVCVLGGVGCGGPSSGAGAQPHVSLASERGLAGAWRWVSSERDGEVVRPSGAADSVVLELGPLGTYREHSRESTVKGRYAFAQGRLFHLQDTAFVVLMMDASHFFPRAEKSAAAIAIRSFRGDTLVVSGTGTDATLYTFVSAGPPQ